MDGCFTVNNKFIVVASAFLLTTFSAMFLNPLWPPVHVLSMVYKGFPWAWLMYPLPPSTEMNYNFDPMGFGLSLIFWMGIVYYSWKLIGYQKRKR